MKKFSKLAAVTQILALTLLAACSSVGAVANPGVSGSNGEITICHATGDTANPYEEITINNGELNDHIGHPNDFTTPVNGCPASAVVISDGKITICHATSSAANPYNEITVSVNGLNGHGAHEGDILPVPDGGCPTTSQTVINKDKITICHATSSQKNPYNEITISVNGLNGHDKHAGDIIPAPAGGCPTTGGKDGGNNGNSNGNNGNGNGNGGGSGTP